MEDQRTNIGFLLYLHYSLFNPPSPPLTLNSFDVHFSWCEIAFARFVSNLNHKNVCASRCYYEGTVTA